MYKIAFYKRVYEDFSSFDKPLKERIKKVINKKLTTFPEKFGKPLKNSLKNFRKLRCGDYRIIFEITKKQVNIITVGHRSIVYKVAIERLIRNKKLKDHDSLKPKI